jgi:hypothetical protein
MSGFFILAPLRYGRGTISVSASVFCLLTSVITVFLLLLPAIVYIYKLGKY